MELHRLINKLSKSSPNAVFTQVDDPTSIDTVDQYLYVKTKIERDYIKILEEFSGSKRVIFLCGSSGDGKSAIIGKNQEQFENEYDFHIDATHSFKPDQSAVDALNDKFTYFKQGSKSLIIGINIGILLNFAREGSEDHEDIRQAIRDYITNGLSSDSVMFINFEDYSKFEIEHENITSSFIHQLFDKVTAPDGSNPFYKAFQDDQQSGTLNIEHINFQLLRIEAVKKSIVELLVTVHLKYDQFLTTRSLLDFLYSLLAGPKLLVNSLFDDSSNAIIENIRKEDPCLLRTAKLDTFVLERKINKTDLALNAFIDNFNGQFAQPILTLDDPHLLVRIFYLFRNDTCSTDYHKLFQEEFYDQTTHNFIKLLYAHEQFEGKTVLAFYDKLENAILAYSNKHLPTLSDEGFITLSEINNHALCTSVEFDPDLKAIKSHTKHRIHSFQCYLLVNDQPLESMEVSLSMYKLIHAINDGYRPNKHDRNTIVIFEELLERIINLAKDTNKLVIVCDEQNYEFKETAGKIKVKSHAR